jgi:hypothetical protein
MVEISLVTLALLFGSLAFLWSTEDLVNIVIKTVFLSAFANIALRLLVKRGYIETVS